jgi:cyclomaltodextrinase
MVRRSFSTTVLESFRSEILRLPFVHRIIIMKSRSIALLLILLVPACAAPERKPSEVPARPSEPWLRDAILYEVSVLHYTREGTLVALEQKIGEIRALGVTGVILLPIFSVGLLNRKGELGNPYAVQDYYEINPTYGTKEDFLKLIHTIHRQNMHLIIDLPIAQTSWDSKLMFDHPDWFQTNEDGAIVSPTAEAYDVAALNYGHHELRKYMIEVMKFWVRDFDIDGFRCAGAGRISLDFWKLARREVEKIRPIVMIADTAVPEFHLAAFDITPAELFNSTLRSVLTGQVHPSVLEQALNQEQADYPRGAIRWRGMGFLRNDSLFPWDPGIPGNALPAATALIFFLPGVPMLTAGIESTKPHPVSLTEKSSVSGKLDENRRGFLKTLSGFRYESAGREVTRIDSSGGKVFSVAITTRDGSMVGIFNLSQWRQEFRTDPGVELLKNYFTHERVELKGKSLSLSLGPFEFILYAPANPTEVP